LFANAHAEAYESSLRDGARYSAGASVRLPVTDKVSLFGAYTHNRRTAESEVFEGRDDSVRANLDWQWDARRTIYLTGEYRRGDVVGSGKEPSLGNIFPHTHDYANTALASSDDAFPGYAAYRFKANTVIATLGMNWSIGPRESIDVSWRRVESKARGSWGVETLYGTGAPRPIPHQPGLRALPGELLRMGGRPRRRRSAPPDLVRRLALGLLAAVPRAARAQGSACPGKLPRGQLDPQDRGERHGERPAGGPQDADQAGRHR
jgi:hypothetical protein